MSVQIFGSGFAIMIVCILFGIILSFVGGTIIDTITTGKTGELIMNNTHINPTWTTARDSSMWWLVNIFYFLSGVCIPLLGVIIFIQSILPVTTGDRYV
jgi:hypothetical protein